MARAYFSDLTVPLSMARAYFSDLTVPLSMARAYFSGLAVPPLYGKVTHFLMAIFVYMMTSSLWFQTETLYLGGVQVEQ